jgi:LDH2 family malate/lactate/ureidoglycolate dehydrogenase
MDKWITRFRDAKTVEGQDAVVIPGDPERQMEQERLTYGIPLLEVVVDDLARLGAKYGLALDSGVKS